MALHTVRYKGKEDITIKSWKFKPGNMVEDDALLCLCETVASKEPYKLSSDFKGILKQILIDVGGVVHQGDDVALIGPCTHRTVWRNMCGICGIYLEKKDTCTASVAMEHTIPDLLVSETDAQTLGREDESRLLRSRKLVLLVDLDQTLIHTTNDNIPNNLRGVFHFQLSHGRLQDKRWYHTKFRPQTEQFLENMSKLFELHIFTFGVRLYAHQIAQYLDPDRKYFQRRILSRDESFHPMVKTSNLTALFPCGESMVCIIDDREDVWKYAPNLVHVKPYRFFDATADINAPPEADKSVADKSVTDTSSDITACRKPTQRMAKIIRVRRKKLTEAQKGEAKKRLTEENQATESNGQKADTVECKSDEDGPNQNEQCEDENEPSKVVVNTLFGTENRKDVEERLGEDLMTAEAKTSETLPETIETEDEEEVEEIEWEDKDDYLICLEKILRQIHAAFYEMYDEKEPSAPTPNLKKIVPYVRRKVLQGVNIVFSGVIPTNQTLETARAYQVARALGANVTQNLAGPSSTDGVAADACATTHLVAAKFGTEKVRMVSKFKSVKIVNPSWLWTCAERWERVNENDYPLNDDTSKDFLLQEGLDPNTGQKLNVDPVARSSSGDNCTVASSVETGNGYVNSRIVMSSKDYEDMMKEVDEMSEDNDDNNEENDSTDEEEDDKEGSEDQSLKAKKRKLEEESNSESESLINDHVKGWKENKRHKAEEDSEDQESSEYDSDSSHSSMDEMARIMERDLSYDDL